jgi:hypothetical protein
MLKTVLNSDAFKNNKMMLSSEWDFVDRIDHDDLIKNDNKKIYYWSSFSIKVK